MSSPSSNPSTEEIERKFRVLQLPFALAEFPSAEIDQGYLCYEPGRGQVRVRRLRDERNVVSHYLTVKRRQGMVRDEVNVPLPGETFDRFWPLTEGRRIRKRRYYIPHRGWTIEVDVFAGSASGLVVAEVEFTDEASANRFVPPDWFGEEVTKDPSYSNVALAKD